MEDKTNKNNNVPRNKRTELSTQKNQTLAPKLSYAFPKCPEKNSYLLQTLITAFKDSLKTKAVAINFSGNVCPTSTI